MLCAQGFGSKRYLARHVCETMPDLAKSHEVEAMIKEKQSSSFGRLASDMKSEKVRGRFPLSMGELRHRLFERCKGSLHGGLIIRGFYPIWKLIFAIV